MFCIKDILRISTPEEFSSCALAIFRFQAANCEPYAEYISYLDIDPGKVVSVDEIPFLPIEFFKSRRVYSAGTEPEIVFTSSGTTGSVPSCHHLASLAVYEESYMRGFRHFYGDPADYEFFALLPSYLEREGSSLIVMAEGLIRAGGGGFFLNDYGELVRRMGESARKGKKILLLGVSYALWELAEEYAFDFPGLIVMETGGMKGRREEITRAELHAILKKSFSVDKIHSEYGMTELLSQGYSFGDGVFFAPPWMKVVMRDIHDPFALQHPGVAGGVNIIDLANIYSCSFIETQDLGEVYPDGSFEIKGRIDNSEIRGCNLMVAG